MGRPLKKKHFGTGSGTQIKVRAKIGSAAEGFGTIVKQKGTNKFVVTVGSDTGLCTLVNKAHGALSAGEMSISVKAAGGTISKVLNVKRHTVKLGNGSIQSWKFDAAAGAFLQVEKVVDTFSTSVISITAQPFGVSVTAPTGFGYSLTATATNSGTLTYQWQRSTNGTTWNNITNGGVYSGALTNALAISNSTGLNGNSFRCIVSVNLGGASVTSSVAGVTVN